MQLLGLNSDERQHAINYFEQGKLPNTDVLPCVADLAGTIG